MNSPFRIAVACEGDAEGSGAGLWLAEPDPIGGWSARLIDACPGLFALAAVPGGLLGVGGTDDPWLREWSGDFTLSTQRPLTGRLPVHLSRAHGATAVAHHLSGAVQFLSPDRGPAVTTLPTGSLPHQVVPTASGWLVPDLGLDAIHELDANGDLLPPWHLPSGCGPRHLAALAGHWALACERSNEVAIGRGDEWVRHPSTRSSRDSWVGDIAVVDAASSLLAVTNRGADTIGLVSPASGLVDEVNVPAWPQHLAIAPEGILVACRDADALVQVTPHGDVHHVVDLPRPSWLCVLPLEGE